tara:strand:- start:270 stop:947 length:678 start_codon:yes stop_codon:yes gene_type:complete
MNSNPSTYIIIFFFLSLYLSSQDLTITGDVDCNGELNSNDASLILQYVTNVIDSLPCQENMTGLTPSQLEEMINMINEQVNLYPEEDITMISPLYDSATFPTYLTWGAGEGTAIYYADAFRFCAQLTYDGYDDWRLPTVSEIHRYVQENPEQGFVIPNHDTTGWSTFWCSAMHDSPSASLTSSSGLSYNVPVVNISGPSHATLPNQILFYGAMGTYSMISCFCVR